MKPYKFETTTRFVKSMHAALTASTAGFKVELTTKDYYSCCPSCDGQPFLSEEGYVVSAPKAELSNLGLMSSSSLYCY